MGGGGTQLPVREWSLPDLRGKPRMWGWGRPDGSHCRLREGNAPARGCFPGASGSLSSLSSKGPCAAAAPPGGAVGKAGPTCPSPPAFLEQGCGTGCRSPLAALQLHESVFPPKQRQAQFSQGAIQASAGPPLSVTCAPRGCSLGKAASQEYQQ